MSTNSNDLGREIMEALRQYSGQLEAEIITFSKETADDLKKALSKESAHSFEDQTHDYRKGWRVKRQGKKFIVHNKTDYQLTHLLEKGHALRRGGRKIGETKEYPHIIPAAEIAIEDFVEKVKGAIRR